MVEFAINTLNKITAKEVPIILRIEIYANPSRAFGFVLITVSEPEYSVISRLGIRIVKNAMDVISTPVSDFMVCFIVFMLMA